MTITVRFVVLATYIFMVVMNALATTLPLNGIYTNEISDKYDTLFAPIGFTFSIWGVIYLLLGVYTVYQLGRTSPTIEAITPWFIASNVLNGAWIIAWHYEQLWLSVIIIVALLGTLIRINASTTPGRSGWVSTLSVRLPFSVYFGWVTVATVANISALLVQQGFQGGVILTAQGWTILILLVAAAIGIATALINSSAAYALVLVWAFFGIYSRHLAPDEWNSQYPAVIVVLQVLLPILAVTAVVALIRWIRRPLTPVVSQPLRATAQSVATES